MIFSFSFSAFVYTRLCINHPICSKHKPFLYQNIVLTLFLTSDCRLRGSNTLELILVFFVALKSLFDKGIDIFVPSRGPNTSNCL